MFRSSTKPITVAWSIRCICAVLLIAATAATARVTIAHGSQLIDRNVEHVTLEVNNKGEAVVSYDKVGKVRHLLIWGAVNATSPRDGGAQTAFKLDYSGGYGKYHTSAYWQAPGWACLPYTGPAIAWLVTACKAPDGSYWALQAWQRALPDFGVTPSAAQQSVELRLSHWTGPLPVLSITMNWSARHDDHLFGTLSYDGVGVYGFRSTSAGVPLDSFGRDVYLDTFDSAYGPGWRRENSFLTHKPGGSFCYAVAPHGSHPAGKGSKYRATVIGPGVTPDVIWEGNAPGVYDPATSAELNDQENQLHDPLCTG